MQLVGTIYHFNVKAREVPLGALVPFFLSIHHSFFWFIQSAGKKKKLKGVENLTLNQRKDETENNGFFKFINISAYVASDIRMRSRTRVVSLTASLRRSSTLLNLKNLTLLKVSLRGGTWRSFLNRSFWQTTHLEMSLFVCALCHQDSRQLARAQQRTDSYVHIYRKTPSLPSSPFFLLRSNCQLLLIKNAAKQKNMFQNSSTSVWTRAPQKQDACENQGRRDLNRGVKVVSIFRSSASNIDCLITHDAPGCLKFFSK